MRSRTTGSPVDVIIVTLALTDVIRLRHLVDVIGIILLRFMSPEKNRPHQTLHAPTKVSERIEPRAPRATGSPAEVITATSTLTDVIRLHRFADVIR